ncbi:MAG: hypothetical protein ACM31L_02555 [Actinomycetota bacterium]
MDGRPCALGDIRWIHGTFRDAGEASIEALAAAWASSEFVRAV